MKTRSEYIVRMPAYALPYLINCDQSGLEDSEKTAIDKFMDRFYTEAESELGSVIVSPGEEEYFTNSPAFGLACNVVDCTILVVNCN